MTGIKAKDNPSVPFESVCPLPSVVSKAWEVSGDKSVLYPLAVKRLEDRRRKSKRVSMGLTVSRKTAKILVFYRII